MASEALLRRLADVEDPPVVSLQIDLDPATTPTHSDVRARVHALFDELRRQVPRGGTHEERARVERLVERVGDRIGEPEEMGLPAGRRMGAAVFAWGDEQFVATLLRQRIADRVTFGRRPALAAVAARSERCDDLLLLVASREQGRMVRFHGGRLEDVFDDHTSIEQRHHQGGWAQMTLQRWVDNAGAEHLREVVRHLARRHPQLGSPGILIAADDEARGTLQRELGQDTAAAVVGWVGNESSWSMAQLIDQAETTLAELDRATEQDLLERQREQTATRGEESPDELQALLDQVSDGQVDWLLLPPAADVPVLFCPGCGRLFAHPGHCPFDGEWLESDDAVDAIACETVRRGGRVWELLDAGPGQIPPDRPAAILRY
jgi:hypothetical protein